MSHLFSEFTNQYSLSKTLRFELRPVGKTKELFDNIQNTKNPLQQVIKEDKKRAEQYKKAKKIIDEYHKYFIDKSLNDFLFKETDIEELSTIYNNIKKKMREKPKKPKKQETSKKDYLDEWQKELNKLQSDLEKKQETLRKEVAKKLKDENLFKKEFIQKALPKWLEENPLKLDEIKEPQKIIKEFNNWTTYFSGFNENRKNIYTDKAQSTSIGYRLIHNNLPTFLDNITRYERAKELKVNFSTVEDNFQVKLDEVFSLNYFNQCLNQKGIERYNLIRGGQSYKDNRKKQGVNEIINLHSQQLEKSIKEASDEEKSALQNDKKNIRSCILAKLDKQILSDQDVISFRLEDIKDDASLCEKIKSTFYFEDEELMGQCEQENFSTKKVEIVDFNITKKIKEAFAYLESANPKEIYIQNSYLTQVSQNIFSNYGLITDCLENYNESKDAKGKKETKKSKEEKARWLKKSYFSFFEIQEALGYHFEQTKEEQGDEEFIKRREKASDKKLFVKYFKAIEINKENKTINILKVIKEAYDDVKIIFEESKDVKEEKIKAEKEKVEKIKNYLDALLNLYHFFKPLCVILTKQEEQGAEVYEKDSSFYVEFDQIFEVLRPIDPLYNQTRNYLTKKKYSTEKYKLNFKNSTLADGWAKSKETDNTCVLLLKDGDYYLAIMDKKHNYLFLEENTTPEGLNKQLKLQEEKEGIHFEALTKTKEGTNIYADLKKKIQDSKDEQGRLRHTLSLISSKESTYQKMIYKYFKDGITMIPKCSTQLKEVKKHFIDDSKNDDYTLKGEGFQTDLIITKNIFDLNNYVFDEKELKFVLKEGKDDKRPKKFQKEYPKRFQEEYFKRFQEEYSKRFEEEYPKKFQEYFEEFQKKLSNNQKDYQEALDQWIKFCERFLKSYGSTANFDYGDLFKRSYDSLDIFYKNLNRCIYNISFQDISSEYINSCVDEEKLYLFQIYSKDFSSKSKGKPNLQTLYWKALFNENNEKKLNDSKKELGVYKLNGQAELFYRKKSIKYSKRRWDKGHHYNKPEKKQTYPIIKDRRYAKDTFLFHVSITCNFTASNINKFNNKVNGFLKKNSDINIIGIDRGERHLAYYTLINQRGEILEQESLNTIVSQHKKDGKNIEKDKNYHSLLDEREKEREKARKSWGTIEKIKDLKAGYLSQVVHKIVTLMIKYNAIIVFEDLNFGFKRGRFKVEKQVYQKLEKMLIDKLNYLVSSKEEGSHEVGGTFNALQLTAPFKSFKEMGKQTGFIFYVPAYHTSKICPATGFVNLLYPRYETLEKAKKFFQKFTKICFNKEKDYFEFHFNYENFTEKAEGSKTNWVICSHGKRLKNYKKGNEWKSEDVELTKELKKLFDGKVDFEDGQCLKSTIDQQKGHQFFKELISLLKLTLQMRNSRINDNEDWLISPVKDKHEVFFDSRNQSNKEMPENADANGAYHIALKGLLMLEQLDKKEDHTKFKPDLSNKAWYQFVQRNNNI